MDQPCVIISNHQSILDMMGGYAEGLAEEPAFPSHRLSPGHQLVPGGGWWRWGPHELAGEGG